LTPRPQPTNVDHLVSTPQGTNKRQSTRLAKKAIAHSEKGVVEIAQDLLVRKLGDLGGTVSNGTGKNSSPDEFDFHAQHFARPLETITMEAIQDLIEHDEHDATTQKKEATQREITGTLDLVA
jgi:hypothetical protein